MLHKQFIEEVTMLCGRWLISASSDTTGQTQINTTGQNDYIIPSYKSYVHVYVLENAFQLH